MKRLEPAERKKQLITIALDMAKKIGYHNVERKEIAKKANVSPGLVTQYFISMEKLRKSILEEAVTFEVIEVLAQGFCAKDPAITKMPNYLKKKVIKHLTK